MAEGLNKWMGLGNLGADPELRMTPSGQAVLKLRLACSETYLDRNKVRQERTEWVSCVVWGPRAEALSKILSKGDRIFVEGRLSTSSYEKDGEKRYRTEIVATNVILNGKGSGRGEGGSRDSGSSKPSGGSAGYDDADYGSGTDDDIPFICSGFSASEKWWR
jgi:single-strand DNA-binding protein